MESIDLDLNVGIWTDDLTGEINYSLIKCFPDDTEEVLAYGVADSYEQAVRLVREELVTVF